MDRLARATQAGRQRIVLILGIDEVRLDVPQAIDTLVTVETDAALVQPGALCAGHTISPLGHRAPG